MVEQGTGSFFIDHIRSYEGLLVTFSLRVSRRNSDTETEKEYGELKCAIHDVLLFRFCSQCACPATTECCWLGLKVRC
jgi:hypothetical protein